MLSLLCYHDMNCDLTKYIESLNLKISLIIIIFFPFADDNLFYNQLSSLRFLIGDAHKALFQYLL